MFAVSLVPYEQCSDSVFVITKYDEDVGLLGLLWHLNLRGEFATAHKPAAGRDRSTIKSFALVVSRTTFVKVIVLLCKSARQLQVAALSTEKKKIFCSNRP
jgi:hypothetical protein